MFWGSATKTVKQFVGNKTKRANLRKGVARKGVTKHVRFSEKRIASFEKVFAQPFHYALNVWRPIKSHTYSNIPVVLIYRFVWVCMTFQWKPGVKCLIKCGKRIIWTKFQKFFRRFCFSWSNLAEGCKDTKSLRKYLASKCNHFHISWGSIKYYSKDKQKAKISKNSLFSATPFTISQL